MLALGVATTLASKEIYVLEHEYYTGVAVAVLSVILVKKVGPHVAKWLDESMDKDENAMIESRESQVRDLKDMIEHEKFQQYRTEAQKLILDAKRENIKMQLEAAYRERVSRVYNEVNIYSKRN